MLGLFPHGDTRTVLVQGAQEAVDEILLARQLASKPMMIAESYPPHLDSRLRGNDEVWGHR